MQQRDQIMQAQPIQPASPVHIMVLKVEIQCRLANPTETDGSLYGGNQPVIYW